MASMSLCMIVKNEEDTLGNCLESIGNVFDEIIIVDTGSTDKTKEIAKKYQTKIYDFVWVDDFSAARNYAFSLATKDYIMWLDADDIILPDDLKKLRKLKKQLNGTQRQIIAKYNVGVDAKGNVNFTFNRERIFLRALNYQWMGAIHEVIAIDADAIRSDFAITHHKIHPTEKGRNLRIFQKMVENQTLDARQKYYFGRELFYNEFFKDAIAVFEDFLESKDGWVEDKKQACLLLSKCYKKENQHLKSREILLKSFLYGPPIGEICCAIALDFMNEQKFNEAIFWYETALMIEPNTHNNSFVELDFYGYIPAIQLCVCYFKIGNNLASIFFNEVAATFKIDDEAIAYNRRYFNSINS